MSIPLDRGVLDALSQLLQHTFTACVNYARATTRHKYTFRDLSCTEWTANLCLREQQQDEGEGDDRDDDLPPQLKHTYVKECLIYITPPDALPPANLNASMDSWLEQEHVLGKISLWYASESLLSQDDLVDEEDEFDPSSDAAALSSEPKALLYKAWIEYRSLAPKGSREALEAEELSMMCFGASVDDELKYGALAGLDDKHGKYCTELQSVRGKSYRFDVLDGVLADDTIPKSNWKDQPFSKNLCVTVTGDVLKDQNTTCLELRLEGPPKTLEGLPDFHFHTRQLSKQFLVFHRPLLAATALPCRQSLLLQPHLAGRVYCNGQYITTWGKDPRIGTHQPALFGVDLHSIPVWHGRIVNYEVLKREYANMWQEITIDARLAPLNLNGMLLNRLLYGKDEPDVGYDDGEYDEADEEDAPPVDTSVETLESQVMSNGTYDPVGICAKALATKFAQEFGRNAFPVVKVDVPVVQRYLGHRTPVEVPQRLLSVLRRGGYFDWKRTMEEIWFTDNVRQSRAGAETTLVEEAVENIHQACADDPYLTEDLSAQHVQWVDFVDVTSGGRIVDPDPAKHFNLVRYHEPLRQFYLHDSLASASPLRIGWILANAHPDGTVAEKYFAAHFQK